jgi:hypothetical protein
MSSSDTERNESRRERRETRVNNRNVEMQLKTERKQEKLRLLKATNDVRLANLHNKLNTISETPINVSIRIFKHNISSIIRKRTQPEFLLKILLFHVLARTFGTMSELLISLRSYASGKILLLFDLLKKNFCFTIEINF